MPKADPHSRRLPDSQKGKDSIQTNMCNTALCWTFLIITHNKNNMPLDHIHFYRYTLQ
uniref:Uncharacterized protein n=1 Tax=Anguilla anguilla TaxID=7936 RepID=A0A0E9RUC5_ANGAN